MVGKTICFSLCLDKKADHQPNVEFVHIKLEHNDANQSCFQSAQQAFVVLSFDRYFDNVASHQG
jgi:hypothetical protein